MELKGLSQGETEDRRNARYLVRLTARLDKRCLFFLLPDLVPSSNDKIIVLFLGVVILLSVACFQVTDAMLCGRSLNLDVL